MLSLGLLISLWLMLADGATGGCDDACKGGPHWSDSASSPEWTTQLWLARAGVAAAIAGSGLWLLRHRALALTAGAIAVVLFLTWYPIASQARFGPP